MQKIKIVFYEVDLPSNVILPLPGFIYELFQFKVIQRFRAHFRAKGNFFAAHRLNPIDTACKFLVQLRDKY